MTKPASLKTFLWFQSDLEAALNFYKETFKDVEIFEENRMGEGAPLFTADFSIYDHQFIGMSIEGGPVFNTAISLSIQCDGRRRQIDSGLRSLHRARLVNVVGAQMNGE